MVNGREDSSEESPGIALGHLALERGWITPEQLWVSLSEQSRTGQGKKGVLPLDAILLAKGFLTVQQLRELQKAQESGRASRAAGAAAPPPPSASPSKALEPSPNEPSELPTLGKYRLLREAGRGAMSIVYEALDTELQRKVALKMLIINPQPVPKDAALEEERFLREARLSANLSKHPHVVTVYEAGSLEGRRYLAMELVQGQPMDEWRKRSSTTTRQAITLLREVALAVHHAHEEGVVHRDLKPANILVDANRQPHVTDFGLAKMMGQNVKLSYTEGGLAVGTPAYMSPEQAQGLKTVDRRTDVYSLGVMLYEIMTGRLPFEGATAMEIMLKSSKDPVTPPSKITTVQMNPFLFKTLEGVCLKALSKNPSERYSTARGFADHLGRWLEGEQFRISREGAKKRSLLAGAAALGVLLLVGLGIHFLRPPSNESPSGRPVDGQRTEPRVVREPSPPPPAPGPPQDPWKKAINLFPRVDLAEDQVSGEWTRVNDSFVCQSGKPALLAMPYRPPSEYDVRLVFARQAKNFCVNLILSKSGQPFALVMQRDGLFGFERIQGLDYYKNLSLNRRPKGLEVGHSYTVRVEVRKDDLRVFLDGDLVCRWKTDYSDLSMNPDWKLPDSAAIGIGAWEGAAILEQMEVLEVTGKGTPTRPPPPNPDAHK
jgi:serine/threonine protein kinase